MRTLLLAVALLACKKSAPSVDPAALAAECDKLLTAAEIEKSCGAKATITKMSSEGSTTTFAGSTIENHCARDIQLGSNSLKLAVTRLPKGQSAEDYVRGKMDAALAADRGLRLHDVTGFVGPAPADNVQLMALVKGNVLTITTVGADACSEEGLMELAKLVADRVSPAPGR